MFLKIENENGEQKVVVDIPLSTWSEMEIGDVSKISLVYIWIMQKLVLPSSHSGNNSRQSAENQGNTPPSAAELETGARLQLCDCGRVARV